MAQPGEDADEKNEALSTTFRCNVQCESVDQIDINDENDKCISLNFTHKKSRQIYASTVTVSGCKALKKKVPFMPIQGIMKLLNDALSADKSSDKLKVDWKLADKALNINVILKSSDEYIPDIVFPLSVPSKTMDPVDILQIRIDELEQENADLKQSMQQQITQLTQAMNKLQKQVTANPILEYRNAVACNANLGILNDGNERCVLQMEIPQRAGKFVVRYSTELLAGSAGQYWIYYYFKLGNTVLNNSGFYLYQYCDTYPFPVSQSFIVTLNGNENAQQRKLALYLHPQPQYPAGMKRCCIECYQIPN